MAHDTSAPDPTRCPLCGADNRCAMEIETATGVAQAACWCVSQRFPPELLASLPAGLQGTACICARCLAAFSAGLTRPTEQETNR